MSWFESGALDGVWKSSSWSTFPNHIPSVVVLHSAMYLASYVDNATVVCFLDAQVIGLLSSMKTNPLVDLRLSRSPA